MDDLEGALELAETAAKPYGNLPVSHRASFLDAIANQLESRREELVARTHRETGLPVARLNGELTRTCKQFAFMAAKIRRGQHLDIRIDLPGPDPQVAHLPEIRSTLRPLGPVVVFGAGNFPFAFSVAGGDTASALAAGCPVIAKSHPEHPGASELAAEAIREASLETGMPEGVYSMLHLSNSAAEFLVRHPSISAGGFTGSRKVGMYLAQIAANRPKPIPFYAEMSSINPLIVLPGALAKRGAEFAKALAASVTLGVGQFCTKPGLVFAVGPSESFLSDLGAQIEQTAPGLMLTDEIGAAYVTGCEALHSVPGVEFLVGPAGPGAAALFATDCATFVAQDALRNEIFGPVTLVVKCRDIQEAMAALQTLEGQLTATLHLEESEIQSAIHLFGLMERIAGRLIVNAFPTGVEVCEAMVHGGPFPATSDGKSTSVGGRSVERWMRPVCYQDVPIELLPPELRPPQFT